MSAQVITVAQQKGGSGKTMLAANLAAAFAARARVAVLDIDPQRSLAAWHALRPARVPAITLSALSGWRVRAELDRVAAAHDVVLIDTPPQIDTDARIAIRAAHLVVVPLQPSPPDWWAAQGTIALARAEKRPLAMVLNRAPATSRLRAGMERDIAGAGHRLLSATLGNRAGFANAFAIGLGIGEAWPKSPAAKELAALSAELSAILGGTPSYSDGV